MSKRSPYPGLRPFTEEESIFFKGRDRHIKHITDQLAREHFIMISGASGDGKSSVVFAGVLPEINAGLLPTDYSDWTTAIVRPEGQPLSNLVSAFSKKLDIPKNKVKEELGYGFSSLLDLFTTSDKYVDEDEPRWKKMGLEERLAARNKASNFLLIIDQFEEFFTHSENLEGDMPSSEATLVLNLVVEAARIAKQRNIPFYIICTMRSDFLVNCGTFRGLPELIGQSHYFIPRLNRSEIYEVINGPAELNGDHVTKRLADYLVNNTREGADQLPILQHCLSRIWQEASKQKEELDLIHLAFVGGISENDLPIDQVERFKSWLNAQSESVTNLIRVGKLSNVINTHAELVYAQSYQRSVELNPNRAQDETERFMTGFFKSIIRYSDGRIVRNRMPLADLAESTGGNEISELSVITDTFREDGTSLLGPGNIEKPTLNVNDTVDITHEALIRNWKRLNNWAIEDNVSYNTFLDFRKQWKRWHESKQHKDYLLSAGPLHYFGQWFDSESITPIWILKYFPEYTRQDAELVIHESTSYIQASQDALDSKLQQKRTRNILAFIAAVIVIISLTFLSVWALNEQAIAKEHSLEAEAQRASAEKSQALAEQQQIEAQKAQKQAEIAKYDALEQEKIATDLLVKSNLANAEARRQKAAALTQRNKAIEASDLAERNAAKAELEKQRAVLSEKELYQLSEKTLKEKLLLEISIQNPDDSLLAQKTLLADQLLSNDDSYYMNQKLFMGYLNTLVHLNGSQAYHNRLESTAIELKPDQNGVQVVDRMGNSYLINNLDQAKQKRFSYSGVEVNKIDQVYRLNDNLTAISFIDNKVTFFDGTGKATGTVNLGDEFCTAIQAFNDYVTIGTSGGKVKVYSNSFKLLFYSENEVPVRSIYSLENERLLAIYTTGQVHVFSKDLSKLERQIELDGTITASILNASKYRVICAMSDGSVLSINLNDLNDVQELATFSHPVMHFGLKEQQVLFMATSNSDIKMMDMISQRLITHHPFDGKIRSMAYSTGNLYVSYEPSVLHIIPVNQGAMKAEICALVNNDFSVDQWNEVVGENIPKKSILCK